MIAATITFVWLIPFFYILITAVRPTQDFFMRGIFAWPNRIEMGNFVLAWERIRHYYLNSIIVTGVTLPILLFVSSLASYALARMKFKFNGPLTMLFLLGFMIPVHVTVFPLYNLFRHTGILNTHLSLILTGIAFGISFNVYLMKSFMQQIPVELEESARIDGASSFRIYVSIILPLSRPVLVVAAVLNFMAVWNEFFFALIFIQSNSKMTVTIGLQTFIGQWSAQYNLMTAGMVLSVIPVLVLFLAFQKYIVQGISEGAIKG